ncbi:hypothetical protein M3Y97_01041900 [Aphelenchoides bicaudatus]|nr:hypothetical protein M3Y97_01041900 [Aphelenchoides bicaudatus]
MLRRFILSLLLLANNVQLLLGDSSALHVASEYGNYETAKALIDKDPQLINATDEDHQTPLHYAARYGNCDIVKMLLSSGADVNALANYGSDDSTNPPSISALYLAAENGHAECVKILLDNGANSSTKNNDEETALHIASQEDHYDVVKALIDKDPKLVNITNKDCWYPLHFAALYGHCKIVSLLLSNGADVNALAKFKYDNSTTPPHVSALYLVARYG